MDIYLLISFVYLPVLQAIGFIMIAWIITGNILYRCKLL